MYSNITSTKHKVQEGYPFCDVNILQSQSSSTAFDLASLLTLHLLEIDFTFSNPHMLAIATGIMLPYSDHTFLIVMATEHCIGTESHLVELAFAHFCELTFSLEYRLILSGFFHLVEG